MECSQNKTTKIISAKTQKINLKIKKRPKKNALENLFV